MQRRVSNYAPTRTNNTRNSSRKIVHIVLSLTRSYNPNDQETPEQRQARMEQVRKIQAAFYRPSSTTRSTWEDENDTINNDSTRYNTIDATDPSLMHHVPLWRVQWTEFPGFQNVLQVHVPHYTHMFRQIIFGSSNAEKEGWYFGHVYLPGGSENLSNLEYALPRDNPHGTTTSSSVATQQNFIVPEEEEGSSSILASKATTIGTLMRITDYREHDDGRLTLLVQGVGRMQVLSAQQQVPYAVADTVRLLTDWEAGKVNDDDDDDNDNDDALERASRRKRAQAITAVREGQLLRDLEFLPIQWPSTGESQKGRQQQTTMTFETSPLSNVNGNANIDWEEVNAELDRVFQDQVKPKDNLKYQPRSAVEEEVLELERQVWIRLDQMLRLLEAAQPGVRIPVPTQLLGLLPTAEWSRSSSEEFRLEAYAQQLQNQRNSQVGTGTKSPFVRLSAVYPEYPVLRRASRLSYAIWVLVGSIGLGSSTSTMNKQAYLETHSLRMRLNKTIQHMDGINTILTQIVQGKL